MTDANPAGLLEYVDRIGTLGLAFIVTALMRGWLITKREYDREISRGNKLEERLDKTLAYGQRAVEVGRTVLDRAE